MQRGGRVLVWHSKDPGLTPSTTEERHVLKESFVCFLKSMCSSAASFWPGRLPEETIALTDLHSPASLAMAWAPSVYTLNGFVALKNETPLEV